MAQQRVDRRRMLKRMGAVGVTGAVVALQGTVPAHAAETGTGAGDNWGLEGTWLSVVALGSPAPPFQSLSTYAAGGGVVTTAQTSLRGAPGMPGSIGSHHGTWIRTGELTYHRHVVAFTFNQAGMPTGTHTVDQTIVIAGDGQTYTAQGTVTFADVSGKVVRSTSAGLEQAARMAAGGAHATGTSTGQ